MVYRNQYDGGESRRSERRVEASILPRQETSFDVVVPVIVAPATEYAHSRVAIPFIFVQTMDVTVNWLMKI